MKNFKRTLVLALGAIIVFVPTNALAQSSGVEIWSQRCGMCHNQQPADRYDANNWESIMTHMTLNARLTSAQADAVLDFLKSGAREVAMQNPVRSEELTVASATGIFLPEMASPEDDYKSNCAPCHGDSGKGDGPAAVAFDPPPADLTDPEVVKNRSAEELVSMIATGSGGMPAFGTTLPGQEIEALAEYIRNF